MGLAAATGSIALQVKSQEQKLVERKFRVCNVIKRCGQGSYLLDFHHYGGALEAFYKYLGQAVDDTLCYTSKHEENEIPSVQLQVVIVVSEPCLLWWKSCSSH